jgi:predicted lipid carrier protein YhbT
MPFEPLPACIRAAAAAVAQRLPAPIHALALDLAMQAMVASHPAMPGRLASFAGSRVRIEIADLSLALVIRFGTTPSLRPARPREVVDTTVRGELPALLALLEGRVDGDTLFFSRAISIRGDVGLVLALRNAVDDAEIDLVADLCGLLGPLAPLARRLAPLAMRALLRLGRDLDRTTAALLPQAPYR